jgi:outer membrane protein OmpA-like peptidoglycan-associated protein
LFPVNSSALAEQQEAQLGKVGEQLNSLAETARALGREIHVTIYGRADQTGAESKNQALSRQRADRVSDALRDWGVAPEMMTAMGLGNNNLIRQGSAAHQLQVNRSVSMKVDVSARGK